MRRHQASALTPVLHPHVPLVEPPVSGLILSSPHGAKADAWCLLIHADASLSLFLSGKRPQSIVPTRQAIATTSNKTMPPRAKAALAAATATLAAMSTFLVLVGLANRQLFSSTRAVFVLTPRETLPRV